MSEDAAFTRREVNRALLVAALALAGGSRATASTRQPVRLFDFAIAGGWHHNLQAALGQLTPGTALRLVREATNAFDPDAVAVHMLDGLKLGYIPREANTPIARLLDRGEAIDAVVILKLTVRISAEIPGDLVFTSFCSGDPMVRLTANAV